MSAPAPVEIPSSAAVSAAADTLAAALDGLDDAVTDITTTWGGLSGVYEAPEAQTAYGALAPVSPAAEDLTSTLATAVSALRTYTQTLSGLETRRAALMADIATVERQAGVEDSERDPDAPTAGDVAANRRRFDADAAAADQECASTLRGLRTSISWALNNGLDIVTGNAGSAVQGLASELLERYRGTLMVPGPGAVLPDEIRLTAGEINPTWPRSRIDGQIWVQRPSGMWMLESNLLPDKPLSSTNLPGWSGQPKFAPAEIGAPPAWASHAGKALLVVGAGLTYWSVYGESYNDTLTWHPDWSEDQRQQEALTDTAVVGTSSVLGGVGGAWGGAAIGAGIGSIFPGPGTIIGGIIGGVIGGVAGGWGAQTMAQDIMDDVRGEDTTIMAPGPLGASEQSTGGVL